MEIESLFSSTRWEIIRILSVSKLSPMELASRMKTTSANISQQLRLLELAGIVKSERISNSDKGKPRIVYSLAGNSSFIIVASPSFAEKKMLPMTAYHNFALRSLFLDNPEHHPIALEFFFRAKEHIASIRLIAAGNEGKELVLYLAVDSQKAQDAVKKIAEEIKKVRVSITSLQEAKKKASLGNQVILYEKENGVDE